MSSLVVQPSWFLVTAEHECKTKGCLGQVYSRHHREGGARMMWAHLTQNQKLAATIWTRGYGKGTVPRPLSCLTKRAGFEPMERKS